MQDKLQEIAEKYVKDMHYIQQKIILQRILKYIIPDCRDEFVQAYVDNDNNAIKKILKLSYIGKIEYISHANNEMGDILFIRDINGRQLDGILFKNDVLNGNFLCNYGLEQ